MPAVVITRNNEMDKAIVEALNQINLKSLSRGKLVAIKPNETWASKDDKTGVTQPDTLRAVIRYLKRLEPRELVVTGGAGAAETDEVFRLTGMMDVIEDEKVNWFDHNRPPFEPVNLEYKPSADGRGPQKAVMVNPRVLEYETLVCRRAPMKLQLIERQPSPQDHFLVIVSPVACTNFVKDRWLNYLPGCRMSLHLTSRI